MGGEFPPALKTVCVCFFFKPKHYYFAKTILFFNHGIKIMVIQNEGFLQDFKNGEIPKPKNFVFAIISAVPLRVPAYYCLPNNTQNNQK